MEDKLFQIICEQVQAINELTEAFKNGHGVGNVDSNITALPQKITFDSQGQATLEQNDQRQGFIAVNKTADLIYGVASQEKATANHFTWEIGPDNTEYYIPANTLYRGEINFWAKTPGNGYMMLTEFTYGQ